jgi:hypothetical protein
MKLFSEDKKQDPRAAESQQWGNTAMPDVRQIKETSQHIPADIPLEAPFYLWPPYLWPPLLLKLP